MKSSQNISKIIFVCFIVCVVGGMIYGIQSLLDKPTHTKKMVQQISMIKPPPPPPPPEIEEPPEPEMEQEMEILEAEEMLEDLAEDMSMEDMPIGDLLGLDADGSAGMDAFGLLAKRGGRDLIGGGSSNPYGWYFNELEQDILDFLYEQEGLRKKSYSIRMTVWLSREGKVERIQLLESTGDKDVDKKLQAAFTGKLLSKPPLALVARPVTIRTSSRL